ncbi:MAG: hypothetical protein CL949_11080 [Erythrobacter sp.]|nr:hypothetical protein [Erythrobacter sp.]
MDVPASRICYLETQQGLAGFFTVEVVLALFFAGADFVREFASVAGGFIGFGIVSHLGYPWQ